jgi:hypothetical protein
MHKKEILTFLVTDDYIEESEPEKKRIEDILLLDDKELAPVSERILSNESNFRSNIEQELDDVNWSVRAYMQYQDILNRSYSSNSLDDSDPESKGLDVEDFMNRNYCYYESILYLRQSILSFLNDNFHSAFLSLDQFFSLCLHHCYWELNKKESGIREYYDWLKGKELRLGRNILIDRIIEYLIRTRETDHDNFDDIENCLKRLAEIHDLKSDVPRLQDSVTLEQGGFKGSNNDIIENYLEIVSETVSEMNKLLLHVYPLILFPVNIHKKFGFFWPGGILVEDSNSKIIRKSVGSDSFKELKSLYSDNTEVVETLEWFHAQKTMSRDKIKESWQKAKDCQEFDLIREQNPNSLDEKIRLIKCQNRIIGWMTNYMPANLLKDEYIQSTEFIGDESEHYRLMYATYGSAVFFAQVLELQVVNMVAVREAYDDKTLYESALDTKFDKYSKQTLGRLKSALFEKYDLPDEVEDLFEDTKNKRNIITHEYFQNKIHKTHTFEGREKIIEELQGIRDQIREAENTLEEIFFDFIDGNIKDESEFREIVEQIIEKEKWNEIQSYR